MRSRIVGHGRSLDDRLVRRQFLAKMRDPACRRPGRRRRNAPPDVAKGKTTAIVSLNNLMTIGVMRGLVAQNLAGPPRRSDRRHRRFRMGGDHESAANDDRSGCPYEDWAAHSGICFSFL
jgi:hypothetical protein